MDRNNLNDNNKQTFRLRLRKFLAGTFSMVEPFRATRFQALSPTELRRQVIVSNERCKGRAETMNNLALVFTGSFLISPFVEKREMNTILETGTYVWVILAIMLHMGAHYLLGLIQPED